MTKKLVLCFVAAAFGLGYQQGFHRQVYAQQPEALQRSKGSARFASSRDRDEGAPSPLSESVLRGASEKALKLLQQSRATWSTKETCTSCHHQLIPEAAFTLARARGISFDEGLEQQATKNAFGYLSDLDAAVQGYDFIDVMFDGWVLTAANLAGLRAGSSMAARAMFIASSQLSDGSWHTIDARPPQSFSPFTTTAVCAQAIRIYMPETLRAEKDARLARAREWLLKTQPQSTEDRTYQLFGLGWTGADMSVRKAVARRLLREQRNDGGWGGLPSLASDAYSTGEVLAALHESAGLNTSDPAYQRGLRFLLNSQAPDGSWHVKSRLHPPAPVSPPYFETGFPYKHDQFISAMGSSWATAAILDALPPNGGDARLKTGSEELASTKQPPWVSTVLSGSVAELRSLLDSGLEADARTSGGTTALMLAARDLEKVTLLLERGADPNAHAETGVTPLMVAARYRGNADVVRLLLKKGARVNPDKGIEVRNNATALFLAVMADDVETVRVLLDAGAKLTDQMTILGRFSSTLMLYAVFGSDAKVIDELMARGASPNEADGDGISALAWAAIANNSSTLKALLARGAQVNSLDKHGMTPLLYAASIDFGDTHILEQLIAAGANPSIKNKDGLTALDLAKNYDHSAHARALTNAQARR